MERPHSALYMGKGKLSEVKAYLEQHPVDVVIFDRSLSPSQLRNLEQILDCAILDRTSLILEIFAERARTQRSTTPGGIGKTAVCAATSYRYA